MKFYRIAILALPILWFGSFLCATTSIGDERNIIWQTHQGSNMPKPYIGYYNPTTAQTLQALNAAGDTVSDLDADSVGSTQTGDLIELGFFDTDSSGTITPNTDTTNLFHGTWTPITSKTTIGQDYSASKTVGAGLFGFETQFDAGPNDDPGYSDTALINLGSSGANYEITDDTPTNLWNNIQALEGATNPLFGIRFYDTGTGTKADSAGATRYNTIMNPNWIFPSSNSFTRISLYDNSNPAVLDTNLEFEFDNTSYGDNGSFTALIGTGGTNSVSDASAASMDTDDFVATVTYHDGDDNLNFANSGGTNPIGDGILSGLNGSGDFTGGTDGNQLTIHSNAGNDGEYDFSGNIYVDSSTATDLTILKTGTGEQTISGNVNISDSDTTESGYLEVGEGTLTLKPGSGKTQKVEFLTGAGTLKLDNADEATQTIELGFANTAEKKTFSGAFTLSGSGTNAINVGGSAGTLASAASHQELSGVVSGAANLKKTGSGKLTLSGNNTFSGGLTIADGGGTKDGGIVVAGHANALGSGTTTVEHGKLAIDGGVTVTTTIQGQGTNDTDEKSIVGGGVGNSVGTINNTGSTLTIGSGNNQIDVVSPGLALATSMSNGTNDHQVIAGNLDNSGSVDLTQSIGTIKINDLALKSGGVFDWEITKFDGTNSAGADWDVLQFDSLAFDSSGSFDINILSVEANGSAGAVTGAIAEKQGTSGFKFIDGSGSNGSGITWGNVQIGGSAPSASGTIDHGYFNLNYDAFSHYNPANYYGDWSVYLDYANNDFYLQYSVAPEPSTYMMVAGLLMLPGYNLFRRLRNSSSKKS